MKSPTIREVVQHNVAEYFDAVNSPEDAAGGNLYRLFMGEAEAALIENIMQYCQNNQTQAAKILGISRNTLKKKLIQHDL